MRMSPSCSRIFVKSKFTAFAFDSVREVDKGHGRIEMRQCWTHKRSDASAASAAAPSTGQHCNLLSGYAHNASKTKSAALLTVTLFSSLSRLRPINCSRPFALTADRKWHALGCSISLSEKMIPAYAKGHSAHNLCHPCVALHSIFSNRIKQPNSASRTRDSRPLGITIISLCSFLTYSESSRLP